MDIWAVLFIMVFVIVQETGRPTPALGGGAAVAWRTGSGAGS